MDGGGVKPSLLSLSLLFSVFKDTKDGAMAGRGTNKQVSSGSLYVLRGTGKERSAMGRSFPSMALPKS